MAKGKATFFVQLDGKTAGPMTGVELRKLALAGKVTPQTEVALSKGEEAELMWVSAKRVKGLFDENGSPLPHPEATLEYLAKQRKADIPEALRSKNTTVSRDTHAATTTQHAGVVPAVNIGDTSANSPPNTADGMERPNIIVTDSRKRWPRHKSTPTPAAQSDRPVDPASCAD